MTEERREQDLHYMYRLFMYAWMRSREEILFDPRWIGFRGSMDKAITGDIAPAVELCTMARTSDPSGMRYVFIGTRFGNAIIHEVHHVSDTDPSPVYKVHLPKETHVFRWINGYYPNERQLEYILGRDGMPNVGMRIEMLLDPVTPTRD